MDKFSIKSDFTELIQLHIMADPDILLAEEAQLDVRVLLRRVRLDIVGVKLLLFPKEALGLVLPLPVQQLLKYFLLVLLGN